MNGRELSSCLLLCAATLLAACSSTAPSGSQVSGARDSAPDPIVAPSAAQPSGPAGMPPVEPSELETLHGLVQEVRPAGHYTYLRVGDGDQGHWAVVMGKLDAEVGDALTLKVHGAKTNFHSRRLDRDFGQVFFAHVLERA